MLSSVLSSIIVMKPRSRKPCSRVRVATNLTWLEYGASYGRRPVRLTPILSSRARVTLGCVWTGGGKNYPNKLLVVCHDVRITVPGTWLVDWIYGPDQRPRPRWWARWSIDSSSFDSMWPRPPPPRPLLLGSKKTADDKKTGKNLFEEERREEEGTTR